MARPELSDLTEKLSYEFNNQDLLEEALRHSSFVNEQAGTQLRDNERFEFLGDAVLNLVIGHLLIHRFPKLKEGDLSRMRSNLVNESQVASIARSLDLGSFVLLGRGEFLTNGREKNSILANTFEALIAAIYIDGGYDAAFGIIEKNFLPHFESDGKPSVNYDYKTRIQELIQNGKGVKAVYTVIDETGPDHDKVFRVALSFKEIYTEGCGKSKKLAEQDAARKALDLLSNNE
ncbi:MAG: ribonuclease III [Desulfobacteraceae bacterium]|nr:MAG: ribonuclease III [Desulfobacteraceae bacterium]